MYLYPVVLQSVWDEHSLQYILDLITQSQADGFTQFVCSTFSQCTKRPSLMSSGKRNQATADSPLASTKET